MIDGLGKKKVQDLMESEEKVEALKLEAVHLPSWDLTPRQVCDIELLLNGAFSPLQGFMDEADFNSVCRDMRLQDGTLWPLPITLDVSEDFAKSIFPGDRVTLRHPEGMVLGVMTVRDSFRPDRHKQAELVYGAADEAHTGVFDLFHATHPVCLGGSIEGVEAPPHHAFKSARHTPLELRALFKKLGWKRIVAFHTSTPMHRAHVELTKRAAAQVEANLLLQPVIGRTRPGNIDNFSRVRCYQEILKHYPAQTTMMSLLPLAMRMGGPREALLHSIIRKNFGCTHFIVGRDHASPAKNHQGSAFYGPYDAQNLLKKHQAEIGIEMVTLKEMVYSEGSAQYLPRDDVSRDVRVLSLTDDEFHRRLREDLDIPSWFSYPEVIEELRRSSPPRPRQGFTVFFTGLSGSGKSTIANVLVAKLLETGQRPVTLLDGDIVRKNLSSELTFSKDHRDLNIQRIGFVASEITKNRGVAVCAPIAPYRAIRRQVRETVSQYGGFIEVHVATPIEVCEQRDRKGLYAKARAGLIKGFTGIDDPYEAPKNAEVVIDTGEVSADQAAQQILLHLEKEGYIEMQ